MKEEEAREIMGKDLSAYGGSDKVYELSKLYGAKGYLEALEKAKEVIFLLGEMIKEVRKNPDHSALVMYAEEALERWEKEK